MKKIVLIFLFITAGLTSFSQTFSIDTVVNGLVNGGVVNVDDFITNLKSDSLVIQWKVVATDFPADWYGKLGICDDNICYASAGCWDTATHTGSLHTTLGYPGGITNGTFHMQINLDGTSSGTHYVTVFLQDDSITTNHATTKFIISHFGSSVNTVSGNDNNISIYPNPATDQAFVKFNLQQPGNVSLIITDLVGLTVYTNTIMAHAGEQQMSINTTSFASGLYNIKIQTGNSTLNRQLSVIK